MTNLPDIVKKLRMEEEQGVLRSRESVVVDDFKYNDDNISLNDGRNLDNGSNELGVCFESEKIISSDEERFKKIVENSQDFIAEIGENGIFIYANPAMAKSLGSTVETIIGKSLFEILPHEIATRRMELGKKVLDGGKKVIVEDERNGRFFNNIFIPIKDVNGKRFVQVIARDITSFKIIENELKNSLKHFKNLFDCIVDPVVIVDSKGKILEMNNSMIHSTGYSRENFIGKNAFKTNILPLKSKVIMVKNLVKRMSGVDIDPYEIELITSSGNRIPFEINATKIDYRGIPADLVVFRDITTRKKMQEKIRLSEERYMDLFENSNDLIQSVNLDGSIIYVNNSWKRTLGYSDDEVSNINIFDIVHPDERSHCEDIFNQLISGKIIDMVETSFITKDGRKIDLEGSINCRFENGKAIATRGIFRNISIRKIAENKLKENIVELENAQKQINDLNLNLERKVEVRTEEVIKLLKQKDDFIHQLSHDLKTPLTPITTLLPIIKKKINDEKLEKMLDIAIQNSEYLKNLVVKTLTLARINSPNTRVEFENINLFNKLNQILEKKYFMVSQNKIKINNFINPGFIVNADSILLEELFDNLISNGIKYKEEEKNVEIILNAEQKNDEIIITISDNGIGMTSEQIENIFDEFYKTDLSRHNLESTGLGLTICKKIVEKMNGKIWAESKGIGKGSTISFTLKQK